jgi:hypothetical protein
MIKGHMDGLMVLKGGQGKATVYFTKDMMHGALDLNETDIDIASKSEDSEAHQEEGPTRLEVLRGMQQFLNEEISRETERVNKEAPLFKEEEKAEGYNEKDTDI